VEGVERDTGAIYLEKVRTTRETHSGYCASVSGPCSSVIEDLTSSRTSRPTDW